MSKKLLFLTFVAVLVLAISGRSQAATTVDINNPSFELKDDGTQCYGHTGEPGLGWTRSGSFIGQDVRCCEAVDTPTHCFCADTRQECLDEGCYQIIPDGITALYMQDHLGIHISQVLDHNIIPKRHYTLTFDAICWDVGSGFRTSFFYGDDPDANELGAKFMYPAVYEDENDPCEWSEMTFTWTSLPGQAYIDQPLAIKLRVAHADQPSPAMWPFLDNVRLQHDSADTAYDPGPEDNEEWVARNVVLKWSPGLSTQDVNGHHVYFGDDESKVISRHQDANRGIQTANSYDAGALHALTLGKTYYWAIDEINDPCVFPATDPWEFKMDTGQARFPKPSNGTSNVDVNVVLSWQTGVDSNLSDIYFGPNEADVNAGIGGTSKGSTDGNTYDAGALEPLELGKPYYWRIDAVNGVTGANWPGNPWSFTLKGSRVVDDFDGYATKNDMTNVWTQISLALIDLVDGGTYPDLVHDGNSMEYYYDVSAQYSEIEANASLLEVGTDWVAGLAKALVLNFRGLSTNAGGNANRMYVGVEDGDGNVGVVPYDGDVNDIKREDWQQWNVALSDFDACDVNLANVDKFYIGFGDRVAKPGGGGPGTVYFDTIELHPARCVPSKIHDKGNFDNDCNVNYGDVAAIGADWLLSEGAVSASAPTVAPIILYDFEDGVQDTDANNTGTLGSSYDLNFPDMNNPWTSGKIGSGGLYFEVNDGNAAEIMTPLNISTNKLTITAWLKRSGDQGFTDQGGFVGVVFARDDVNNIAAGLTFGAIGDFDGWTWWTGTNQLAYNWNNNQDTWEWQSQLIPPDNTWTFVALVVDGAKATMYMSDGVGAMQSATNYVPHRAEDLSTSSVQIGNDGNTPDRAYAGDMDEVRIYDYALSPAEVLSIAGGGTYNQQDLTTDILDDGTVNFKDYDIVADNWLKEILWP